MLGFFSPSALMIFCSADSAICGANPTERSKILPFGSMDVARRKAGHTVFRPRQLTAHEEHFLFELLLGHEVSHKPLRLVVAVDREDDEVLIAVLLLPLAKVRSLRTTWSSPIAPNASSTVLPR